MIADLRDLEKLFKICRRQGIVEMDYQGIKFKLGDLPREQGSVSFIEDSGDKKNPYSDFPDRELTPEELMYYSSGGELGIAPPEEKAS